MPSRKIEDAHVILQKQYNSAKAAFEKQHEGVKVFLTATYRSKEEQDVLYAQGRTTKGQKVTNAKGGQSAHNFKPSMAIDVAFDVNGKTDWSDKWFILFAPYMKNPNITWGGNFKSIPDKPHYEVTGWKELVK
jgi:peptidoglycan L-alanyl-D-glutamate endopeptidase CwlK